MSRAKRQLLHAGPLTVELKGGNVGAIRFNGIEVLRGLSYLVRDENWGTCPAKISAMKIEKKKSGFSVHYSGSAENHGARLSYRAQIRASARLLQFRVTATPDKDFSTNRTGFVVLHPIAGVAGKSLVVTHTDGTRQKARFPKLISPGQPFFDIRALEHTPAPGLKAHVLMEGNKFEMEDQRNWSDASFKTYVCSLLDPWPYVLKANKDVAQCVTLTLKGTASNTVAKPKITTAIKKRITLPEIGIAIPQAEAEESLKHRDALRRLAPRHLTGTLDATTDIESASNTYAQLQRETHIPLTLEVILSALKPANDEMARVAQALKKANLHPQRIMVTQAHDLKSFQPTDTRPWGPSYKDMATAARFFFPQAQIGGGMISFFTELNRKRPPQGLFDFVSHSICPIVHDASDEAVLQTLESLPSIFDTTRSFIGDTPYHLGPTSLGARMNPYGKALASNPKGKRICLAANDPRQFKPFAVDWNSGVILAAARAGLQSITLSTLTGPQGLIDERGKESPLFRYLCRLSPLCGKTIRESLLDPKLK